MDISVPHNRFFDFLEQHDVDPVLLTYMVLLISATAVIYSGSHATLHKPDTALPPDPTDENFDPSDLSIPSSKEKLMEEDAYLMPVMGGFMLVGLYFLIKKLDRKYIEIFLNSYFALFGVVAVATASGSLLNAFNRHFKMPLRRWKIVIVENPPYEDANGKIIKRPYEKENIGADMESEKAREDLRAQLLKRPTINQIFSPSFILSRYQLAKKLDSMAPKEEEVAKWFITSADITGWPIGLGVVLGNWYTQNWILGNILGASFAFSSIKLLTIDSFKTGFILLSGLFFYDIFFVFGTDIMVTVATSLTVPIKLTAPRPATASTPQGSNAMLGLGDIIVPAIFLSLCLRFDLWNFHRKNPNLPYSSARKFPKPFFTAGIVLYVVALTTTIFVMHYFKTAQPALLYLCPGIAGAAMATAIVKKEWSIIWSYKEESEDDQKKKIEEKEKEKNSSSVDESEPQEVAVDSTDEKTI
ncbi:signal peptide peptidase-domain-containing protein [Dipodascopsis uninucleata]